MLLDIHICYYERNLLYFPTSISTTLQFKFTSLSPHQMKRSLMTFLSLGPVHKGYSRNTCWVNNQTKKNKPGYVSLFNVIFKLNSLMWKLTWIDFSHVKFEFFMTSHHSIFSNTNIYDQGIQSSKQKYKQNWFMNLLIFLWTTNVRSYSKS